MHLDAIESLRDYFREKLEQMAIQLRDDFQKYVDRALGKTTKKSRTKLRGGKKVSRQQVINEMRRGRKRKIPEKLMDDEDAMSNDSNNSAVGDETEYTLYKSDNSAVGADAEYGDDGSDPTENSKPNSGPSVNRKSRYSDGYNSFTSDEDDHDQADNGSAYLRNSPDGTWSDEETRYGSDTEPQSDFHERLGEDISQHGAYRHYPNGDMDADDCPPNCSCISCDPKPNSMVSPPNPRHYTRLNGRYTLDDCRTGDTNYNSYYSDGNNPRTGCSDGSKGDCRKTNMDDLHYYSDGGNNSNAGCTDESAGGYSSDESFGDG